MNQQQFDSLVRTAIYAIGTAISLAYILPIIQMVFNISIIVIFNWLFTVSFAALILAQIYELYLHLKTKNIMRKDDKPTDEEITEAINKR